MHPLRMIPNTLVQRSWIFQRETSLHEELGYWIRSIPLPRYRRLCNTSLKVLFRRWLARMTKLPWWWIHPAMLMVLHCLRSSRKALMIIWQLPHPVFDRNEGKWKSKYAKWSFRSCLLKIGSQRERYIFYQESKDLRSLQLAKFCLWVTQQRKS